MAFYFPKAEQGYTIASDTSVTNEKTRGWSIDVGARVPVFRMIGEAAGRTIEIRAAHRWHQFAAGSWNRIAFPTMGRGATVRA